MTSTGSKWDAIVIGSGIGGLTVAGLLARLYHRKVLLLERHGTLGGFTHAFRRPGGFHWDVGLHYVGRVDVPCRERDTMLALFGGDVTWAKLEDPFEEMIFPDLRFCISSGEDAYRSALVERFPEETRAIDHYFRDVHAVQSVISLFGARGLMPGWLHRGVLFLRSGVVQLAKTKTRDYLNARFRDPMLRAIIGARWGDYGLPPGESAFAVHATIMHHYFDGAWFPVGGSSQLAASVVWAIEAEGGMARTNAEVASLCLADGRAVGVRLTSGEEIFAPTIVSAAGVRTTLQRLLPPEIARPYLADIEGFDRGYAAASVHLGLRDDPRTLGVHGQNFWYHDALDHDAMYARRNEVLTGPPPSAFLSFPSVRDPHAKAHTAEIMAPVDIAPFAAVDRGGWRRRGDTYAQMKHDLSDRLLALAETLVPGLGDLVVHAEPSSPLTIRHFANHAHGEIYGLPFTPARLALDWLGPRGMVPGLYLAGVDVMTPGIFGGMMGGMMAVAAIEGVGAFRRVAREAQRLIAEGRDGIYRGEAHTATPATSPIPVRVEAHEMVSADAASITLVSADGGALPPFTAGAHVSVFTPEGWVRPYSLCNDPSDRSQYRLGVLAIPGGRTSRELVAWLSVGQLLRVGLPQNHFPLPDAADEVLLMGAGIGITPMMAMAYQLQRAGRPFVIHHSARDQAHAPFHDELQRAFGERYRLHCDDGPPAQRLDLDATLAPRPGRHLLMCGPPGYMDWLHAACVDRGWDPANLHQESFTQVARPGDTGFQVRLARSGRTLDVPPDRSIADTLEAAGISVAVQCGTGTCGSCLCGVLEGAVEHRDTCLTEGERAQNNIIALCVSRAREDGLVLDL